MTKITPETLRGAAYARLGIPGLTRRRKKQAPLKPPAGYKVADATAGVFRREMCPAPLQQPTDKRRRKVRPGSLATIGEILASK